MVTLDSWCWVVFGSVPYSQVFIAERTIRTVLEFKRIFIRFGVKFKIQGSVLSVIRRLLLAGEAGLPVHIKHYVIGPFGYKALRNRTLWIRTLCI